MLIAMCAASKSHGKPAGAAWHFGMPASFDASWP
jgi:hypothetical protein